jgi:hypothetical protein
MQKRTNGTRRSFLFDPDTDVMLLDQVAASGATMTETLRRALRLRERVRTAHEPTALHPKGERLCFEDIATGRIRYIDWL